MAGGKRQPCPDLVLLRPFAATHCLRDNTDLDKPDPVAACRARRLPTSKEVLPKHSLFRKEFHRDR
ncbi:protein of unknown function [Candidatus Methylocalor cossyra]|uniref:Uncharacterized protein n=1 Tax=Candidatus Methylocalor cossyra TaxID=3108543 RepID=A0ABP1CFD3_9GAMM